MIKIRLHGTAEEVRHATKEIKERFDVLNVSEPYADRGESVYNRVYIDAETKDNADKTLDGFKNELEKEKQEIIGENVYETYANGFMLAAAYFKHNPTDIYALENVLADFALNQHENSLFDKILAELLRGVKNEKN